MNEQLLRENLFKFGLDEDEVELYLFLLRAGPKTPLEISRESNINRTKIYRLVERMQKKNLIEDSNTAWGQKLKAAPPENLNILLEQEEDNLLIKKNALPELLETLSNLSTNSYDKFEVKHYKGIEGIKQMVWNELKGQEIVIFGYQPFNDMVGRKFAEKVRQEAILRRQKTYEIQNLSENEFTENKIYLEKHFEGRTISEDILKIRHHVDTYNDTVNIFNWADGNPYGIEIINKPLADMYRQIFWHYWELAK